MKDKILHQLKDYILLNAFSVHSPGFYNGKAGISLCLFECARYLKDEQLEDAAFELIQQSIILGDLYQDHSFKSGLSGIGFVILYLLENNFLEGDFEEFFGKQLQQILSGLNKIEKYSESHLFLLYFLALYNKLKNDKEIESLMDKILINNENILKEYFHYFNKYNLNIMKFNILDLFINYLKIISYINNYTRSLPLIEMYTDLFAKNKICCNYIIGNYIEDIGNKINNMQLKQIGNINQLTAIKGLFPNILSLKSRIELLFLISEKNSLKNTETIKLLEGPFYGKDFEAIEQKVFEMIPIQTYMPGYQSGISRLLLYYLFKKHNNGNKDYSRFNYLLTI